MSSVRILLIDAQDEARASLAQRLRRSRGLELVGVARDADEAARVLAGEQPDIVLVDLHQTNGLDVAVCREVRQVAAVPLVVLASFMTAERWEQLREVGARDCLLKHVDSDRLGRELRQLSERYQSESGSRLGPG